MLPKKERGIIGAGIVHNVQILRECYDYMVENNDNV